MAQHPHTTNVVRSDDPGAMLWITWFNQSSLHAQPVIPALTDAEQPLGYTADAATCLRLPFPMSAQPAWNPPCA